MELVELLRDNEAVAEVLKVRYREATAEEREKAGPNVRPAIAELAVFEVIVDAKANLDTVNAETWAKETLVRLLGARREAFGKQASVA